MNNAMTAAIETVTALVASGEHILRAVREAALDHGVDQDELELEMSRLAKESKAA